MGQAEVSKSTLSADRFITTPRGSQWLEQHPDLADLISQFCTTEDKAELTFRPLHGDGVEIGGNSAIYPAEGVAIKVSTWSTGRYAYKVKSRPEDLIKQFVFMSLLGEHFRTHPTITVPEQYLALRSGSNYLRIEQYMRGWHSLGYYVVNHMGREQIPAVELQMRERVVNSLGNGLISFGLSRGRRLHAGNLLVPDDSPDPVAGEVCIIDQPTTSLTGTLVTAYLSNRHGIAPTSGSDRLDAWLESNQPVLARGLASIKLIGRSL